MALQGEYPSAPWSCSRPRRASWSSGPSRSPAWPTARGGRHRARTSLSATAWRPSGGTSWPTSATSSRRRSAPSACSPRPSTARRTPTSWPASPTGWPPKRSGWAASSTTCSTCPGSKPTRRPARRWSRCTVDRRPGGRAAAVRWRPARTSASRSTSHPAHLAVPGDRRDLVSAVSNLVDNAIKYSERGSLVQVRVQAADGDQVDISVVDHGIGSRRATSNGSSNGSTGWTGPGPRRPAAPGSACPSSATWRSIIRFGRRSSPRRGGVDLHPPPAGLAASARRSDAAHAASADQGDRRGSA